jgi:hypothetical protein
MDKDTRSAIERATQRARKLLEADFAEQLGGVYDILRSGEKAAGAHLGARQRLLREKILASIEHKRAAGVRKDAKSTKEDEDPAVADYLRDAAFTTLNRFVALKMLEARELVQECISKGDQSAGFKEYCGLAPGVALLPDGAGYRLYLDCIFDELSTEVKVLFDRRDVASVLWPRRPTLEALLELLNAAELAGVWGDDETIGWVYQFFNSGEERRAMRDASQAPRNSRELAVRNQFFTPRYVVQFLTDNTLGRIWYEMRQGETGLAELCEYMVRRPGETYAPRSKKDPRDLRVLDPACGSGHFLLYAFDLLIPIYEEAWADPSTPRSEATGKTLRDDHASLDALRRAIPELVLRHNLHGVDIDPRCAQIAQLALWMRAQRAFRDAAVARARRPRIRRANIVIAEPMPGDASLVEAFASTLDPPLLGELFKKTVGEMRLAGDLGLLLRIEVALAGAIRTAREQFVAQQKELDKGYLPGFAPVPKQGELDLSGIDDQRFFEEADARIVAALERFVGSAAGSAGIRRRLFADDAAQGLGLVELCEKKFDVVLMNPPFGAGSTAAKKEFERSYLRTKNENYAAFVERGIELLRSRGRLGAITSRTGFFLSSFQRWREEVILGNAPPVLFADFGQGVLDSAMVETAAYCLEATR